MDTIKQSITELSAQFNARMEEFQRNIQGSIPAASPSSNIAAQFSSFRSFVLAALEGLQIQVRLLYRSNDELEMRSRRKILLVHGIPERKEENVDCVVTKVLAEQLKTPVDTVCVSRCHCLGRVRTDKPRDILIKFRDLELRNKLWYAKTGLRNSEFLTRDRHDLFVAARQHSVSPSVGPKTATSSWLGKTARGIVSELDSIPASSTSASTNTSAPETHKVAAVPLNIRSKRAGKR